MTRVLDTAQALADAIASLGRLDPVMAAIGSGGGMPPLRKRDAGFAALAGIVVSQQVSTASAAAIMGRLEAAFPVLEPRAVAAASDETLLGVGLSRAKLRAVRAIADAIIHGALPLAGLVDLPAEAAHAALTAIRGIGPWTADVYLLFCLGHPDVFPSGDLALQEAARLALDLPARPGPRAMAAIAERWRPWRGAAAYLLWAHYRRLKGRDGAAPPTASVMPAGPATPPAPRRSGRARPA